MSEILFHGSQVVFATDDPARALIYLQKSMPDENLTAETAKPILDMVMAKKIRIGDPIMYRGQAPVYAHDNYSPEDVDTIKAWCEKMRAQEDRRSC